MARFTVPSPTASSSTTSEPSPPLHHPRGSRNPLKFNKPRPYVKQFPRTGSSHGQPTRPAQFRVPSESSSASPTESESIPGSERSALPGKPRFEVPSASSSSTGSESSPQPSRAASLPQNSMRADSQKRSASSDAFLLDSEERLKKVPRLEANLPKTSQDGAALLADKRQRKEPPTPSGNSIIAGVAEPSNTQATGNVRSDAEGVLSHENIVIAHQGAREEIGAPNDTSIEPGKPGSLIDLIRRNRPTVGLPTKQSLGLPESLLWHTLISLLKAMLYLHTGRQDHKDSTAHKDWMPVVHNLINPETISYGEPPSGRSPSAHGVTRRPAYGVCKLGNFSQCVVLQSRHNPIDDREVTDRREVFQHLHSRAKLTGYEAPELQVDGDELSGPASDLWSIGAVMVSMMTGGKSVWDLVREIKFADHAQKNRNTGRLLESWTLVPTMQRRKFLRSIDGEGDIVMALPRWYSFDLRILIEGLLASNPLDRGEAIDVLEDAVSKFEKRAGEGDYEGPSEAEEMTRILAKSRRAFREAEAYLARTRQR
ncbi:Serine/threonine-protein kinase Nek11 [Vermiconidia calcicola]|uniref:Serine/threonine-protein kinase Nek11 n=1 Tax=Vermiconidia calcicola TaxID=1690605 RepID=A0ACC3N2J6_9PEZI|nr:Serine/threonine-protein kinase Nek11 [Vermiconidia calcicola]